MVMDSPLRNQVFFAQVKQVFETYVLVGVVVKGCSAVDGKGQIVAGMAKPSRRGARVGT